MWAADISDPLAWERVMADYRVLFFNNLVNSYGKPFKCLQWAITVSSAKDAGEASEKAQREFERYSPRSAAPRLWCAAWPHNV
jgi:hypothetical protein